MKTHFDFRVYPDTSSDIAARAFVEDGELKKVQVKTKMARGYYYSVLGDAIEVAVEMLAEQKQISNEEV